MILMLAAHDIGLAAGFAGTDDPSRLQDALGIPAEFVPVGVIPVGRPLPDLRSPSLKRGWLPIDAFAHFDFQDGELLSALEAGAAKLLDPLSGLRVYGNRLRHPENICPRKYIAHHRNPASAIVG